MFEGILNSRNIWVAETKEDIHDYWENEEHPHVNTSLSSCEVAQKVDVIFLGFPAYSLTDDLNNAILPSLPYDNSFRHKLIVSLIPGVTCDELAKVYN